MFLLIKRAAENLRRVPAKGWLSLLATELVIVFIGVYMAQLLTDWRGERERVAREALFLEGLREDVEPFLANSELVVSSIRERYDAWTRAYEAGQQPPLFFVAATYSLARPHGALWSAMLQSGGLDLLPVDLLGDVSEFYVRTDRMIARYNRLDDFVRSQVLPNIGSDNAIFYEPDTTRLRPMFATYVDEAAAAIAYAEDTVTLGRAIEARLADGP